MKTLKWSTTLVLLALAAALVSVMVFVQLDRLTGLVLGLAALGLLVFATLRGKPGV